MKWNKHIDIGENKRRISKDSPPYFIAEISANHNNSLSRAKEIIESAALAGASAVKFQTYRADTITLDSNRDEFVIKSGLWNGRTLYDLYSEGALPWEWHEELFNEAWSLGLDVLSSPFDESAVDFLNDLGVDGFKIASFELTHIPLIEKCASSQKPVIVSTGMSSTNDVLEALESCKSVGNSDVVLLHCVSAYPTPAADYKLGRIKRLGLDFDVLVGLSDHSTVAHTAVAAVALGAVAVEKHFTVDRSGGGLDDSFSIEPAELSDLIKSSSETWISVSQDDNLSPSEADSKQFRRSIYASKKIKAGEVFSKENIRVVRPSYGLHPRHYNQLIGRISQRDIDYATPITINDLL